MERIQKEQIMSEKIQRIDEVLSRLFYKTEILAALIRQGEGRIDNFDKIAPSIVDDPAILNILIAPNGVVSHAYSPVSDVSPLIGHDFFEDSGGNIEAILAIESGELLMAGPFVVRQGYTALAGRLPVFLDAEKRELWGLVSVTLRFPEALDNAQLENLRIRDLEYELWRIDPDTNEKQVLDSNLKTVRPNARYIEKSMQIQNATWYLRLISTSVWYHGLENIALVCAGFLISFLAAFLMQNNVKLRQTKAVLEVEKNRAEEARETIIASINYANKIQRNLLPNNNIFDKTFSDYSVIWEPCDIVGGDIYWIKQFEAGAVLVVADCTGHGTPGALLTMLVVSTLESVVTPSNCHDTANAILALEQRLTEVFNVHERSKDELKDGCDLAVLFIGNDKNITVSAGHANVFICDGKEVTRHRGQNLYVGEGKIKSKDKIETLKIPYSPDNKFYIASDGLYDQPGENGEPFGYKRFEKLILENHSEKQSVISDKIWKVFETHRGNEAKVDDFQLITFKI